MKLIINTMAVLTALLMSITLLSAQSQEEDQLNFCLRQEEPQQTTCLYQIEQGKFQVLPKEIQTHALEVRASCKELMSDDAKGFTPMQGINIYKLNGSRAIFVDNEALCNSPIPAGNCSNRGCDLTIYKLINGRYRKIFNEHLHAKYIALDYEHQNATTDDPLGFQLMVATIYGGDKRCKPNPHENYTSGRSCNLIVTYKNNTWHWQKIE